MILYLGGINILKCAKRGVYINGKVRLEGNVGVRNQSCHLSGNADE